LSAVHEGHVPRVRQLLQKGADAKMTDDCGISILTYATSGTRRDIMKLLIENGANVNARDRAFAGLPLAHAIDILDLESRYAVTKILIDAGADVNVELPDGTPLMAAVSKEDVRLVELLIASGANVNSHDDDGRSAYSAAAVLGNGELKKILLKAGADPTVGIASYKKEWGEHAFLQAAADGRVDVVEAMLSNGAATVNQTNGHKVTALMRAHDYTMVEALLKAGADVSLRDDRGFTALTWAREIGDKSIIEKLIAAGAETDEQGATMKEPQL